MGYWLKLYYELLEWEWLDKPEMVSFFIYCLLKANRQGGVWRGVPYRRGEFITSNATICKDLGLTERRARTCISRLISTGEITYRATNRYCIITVCNYDKYQLENFSSDEQKDEQPTSNRRATDDR